MKMVAFVFFVCVSFSSFASCSAVRTLFPSDGGDGQTEQIELVGRTTATADGVFTSYRATVDDVVVGGTVALLSGERRMTSAFTQRGEVLSVVTSDKGSYIRIYTEIRTTSSLGAYVVECE